MDQASRILLWFLVAVAFIFGRVASLLLLALMVPDPLCKFPRTGLPSPLHLFLRSFKVSIN